MSVSPRPPQLYACDTDRASIYRTSFGMIHAARGALLAGAPISTDATMIAAGITRRQLPCENEVLCTLQDPRVPQIAAAWGTTRSAAAVSLWHRLEWLVVHERRGGSALAASAVNALTRKEEI